MFRHIKPHSHSVAANDNPHGDTKLSSSRGTTQEREHETLAEGHPSSKRSISEAHPARPLSEAHPGEKDQKD
jgi:hypothetical protein